MVSLAQYAGFGDTGKELKNVALASAIATLVLPLSTVGTFIIMGISTSSMYSYFHGDYMAYSAFSRGTLIAAFCIVGALIFLFYLAILNYKIRAFKSLKNLGERHGNADISTLAKHQFVELVLTLITSPLYAVTAILIVESSFMSIPVTTPWRPVLLLFNCIAMAITGMYSLVDGFKKWHPVWQMLTSYKGRAGIQYQTTSQGVGLAIIIISHYVMAYFLTAASSPCSYSYSGYCSFLYTMAGILVPVGIVIGILTLITAVNHIKGFFRVGNAFIDLEEGRMATAPYGGTHYHPPQVEPYSIPGNYPAATGGGYQHSTWNAPRYSQAMQPMNPVEQVMPVVPSQPAYRDTKAIDAGWQIDGGVSARPAESTASKRCKGCQAVLPETEDVAFCPYCGARV
jgi:hypothetical protein